ncbi:MAG: hypothetical protein MJE68_03270 [Proteobacteria bacterium]|nr:hypothetical protein [Pseudomonadota bacterium]
MPYAFLHSVKGHLVLKYLSIPTVDLSRPILEEAGNRTPYTDQEVRRLLVGPLSHIFNHVSLVPKSERPTVV